MDIQEFIEKFKSQLEDSEVTVTPETNYVKSGSWDSLTAMVIKVMIEDDYKVDVELEKLNSFGSVAELFEHIKGNQ